MRGSLLVILPLFVFWPLFADAQASNAPGGNADNAALMQRMRELEDRVIALEGQVRLLKSQAAPAAAPSGQPAATSEAGRSPLPQHNSSRWLRRLRLPPRLPHLQAVRSPAWEVPGLARRRC